MSKIIYKYELTPGFENHILVPHKSKILDCMVQNGVVCVWVERPIEYEGQYAYSFKFIVMATGAVFTKSNRSRYLKSFQIDEFVGHVYYTKESIVR